jgi:hypothetical protein
VLAHPFDLRTPRKRPDSAALLTPGTAWKLPGGRDEYLVFTQIGGCLVLSPWEMIRSVTSTDDEGEVLLCAAYLNHLKVESGNGIRTADALALLKIYGY